MKPLAINLLRGRIPDAAARRRSYMLLLAYLAGSGLLLVGVAGQATRKLVEADYHRRDGLRLLAAHAEQYPGDATPDATLTRLRAHAGRTAAELDAVEKILDQRLLPARVLLGLRQPLPDRLLLVDLTYDRPARRISFGVAARQDTPAPAEAADLIARWKADPLLSDQVHDLKPVRTDRVRRHGQEVLVERFVGAVGAPEDEHGSRTIPP